MSFPVIVGISRQKVYNSRKEITNGELWHYNISHTIIRIPQTHKEHSMNNPQPEDYNTEPYTNPHPELENDPNLSPYTNSDPELENDPNLAPYTNPDPELENDPNLAPYTNPDPELENEK